ncbi:MAG: 2-succinyl-5-enolpyruvyl-6-hydroxy-3-cyclohexene-1-carboxylic-acid synthase [Bacteroidota bacterium]
MPRVEKSAAPSEAADTGALNLLWASAFAGALAEAGVREAVIAPGSRSAPLAVALHRSSIRTHVALDERAGAYFALGMAKASRRPAAVLCTSGTAAANFHPAILEARHARVPLIALTADRPPELRDTGAPQTVDQIQLFGNAVRWFCEVGTPEPGTDALRYVASLGARAAREALGPPAGPVHLNFPFREPLLPDSGSASSAEPASDASPAELELPDDGPAPAPRVVERFARLLRARRRGLILCGPGDGGPDFREAIGALSAATGYPILADPLSGIRYGSREQDRVFGAYDVFLRSSRFVGGEAPEAFVRFGAAPTSKALARYAARFPEAIHLAVDAAGEARDPSRLVREVAAASPAPFARALAEKLARGAEPLAAWGDRFGAAEEAARYAVEAALAREQGAISEAGLFPALLDAVPENGLFFVGNSMPVRDLDSFAPGGKRPVQALANRGVNGIDGVLSTALGASAASEAPVLVALGDLSFHHDLNALAALREGRARAVIVVVNNDGGGIFSLLPVAEHGDVFDRYFGTPHGLDFAHAAALYGIPYARPARLDELRERASEALRTSRNEMIEIRTDRAAGAAHRHAILAEAVRAVERVS